MIGRHTSVGAKVVGLILGLVLLVGVGGILSAAWAQTPLTNGVSVNSNISFDFFRDFSIVVPSGATLLTVTTTNATGDVDLYVRRDPGDHILPDDDHFDCRPFTGSGNETCQFTNPQAGTWFVSVFGFDLGTHSFTVTATFQTGPGGGSAEAFVTRLYQEVLGRDPEPGGVAGWVQQIAQFGSVVPTTLAFFHSAEFLGRNTSNAQFLTILYRTFLNRDPDSAGLDAFLTALQTGQFTRDNLLAIFIDSAEFAAQASFLPPLSPQEDFVSTLYVEILGRGSDQPGLQGFVAQLQQNCDLLSLIRTFLASPEFLMRNTNNTEFVTILYRIFLDRIPDVPGLTGFVTQLNQGTATRDQLLNQLAASAEFQTIEDEICAPPPATG